MPSSRGNRTIGLEPMHRLPHPSSILPTEGPMIRAVHFVFLLACTLLATAAVGFAQSSHHVPGSPPVMDLHTDILLRAIDHGVDIGNAPEWTQVNLATMEAGNVQDQVFSVWVNSRGVTGLAATRRALQMIDIFEEQAARHADRMALATSMAESERIRESGRIAVWLWLEGGAPIADDLALLRTFHRLGVRGMTLAWTNNLLWAGSSSDPDNDQMGLTDFGREVVGEMNRIGMIVDISHVSERTFYDALEVTTKPVVASHTGCRALCDHDRNLTDDQLRAIAANGGVVGIAAFNTFLKDEWNAHFAAAQESVSDQLDALLAEHAATPAAWSYREARRLLIQSAMPPKPSSPSRTSSTMSSTPSRSPAPDTSPSARTLTASPPSPIGLEKASDWPKVAEAMRARGFDEETIRAVFAGNARRVFREVLDGEGEE
jgi:membrane dipeptidase